MKVAGPSAMGQPKRQFLEAGPDGTDPSDGAPARRVALVEGVLSGPDRFASLAALFPDVIFESAGPKWPDRAAVDILIVPVWASATDDVTEAVSRLRAVPDGPRTVVVLHDADVTTTRRLIREGAADVLLAPLSEAGLALCLERLLIGKGVEAPAPRKPSSVVAVLKAGGGVGATTLAVQVAALLAGRGAGEVCLADLDLQFGAAALYLDLTTALTLADLLGSKTPLAEAPFSSALATHRSGVRLLAAPNDVMALETLSPEMIESLLRGLRREFPLTIVDMPSAWTAWTSRLLMAADRIVMVTHLSVPHIQLVKRQFRVLAAQGLGQRPVTLVCNGLSKDHETQVSLKAAERALGRPFDVVIPEDRSLVHPAINRGVELAAIRRGSKMEQAVTALADLAVGTVDVAASSKRKWW